MATIKDVARLAGVGVGTASRVISGRGPVALETALKVKAAIAELDFHPSHIARALSAKSPGTIGVFVPDFGGAYYAPILRLLDEALREVDRHMVAVNGCGHGGPRQQALDGVTFLIERECDGILVFSNELTDEDLIELRRRQAHLAVMNRFVAGLGEGCFSMDHHLGGALAAQMLWDHGHRKMAVISGPDQAGDNRERLDGFFEVLQRHGIARDEVPMANGNFTLAGGWEATLSLLRQKIPFTGLFAASDEMALSAIACLHQLGISVPGEISIVGYDDIDIAAYTAPRLTSIHAPAKDLALSSLRWLLNQCYGMHFDVQRDFTVSVTMRDSVARRELD